MNYNTDRFGNSLDTTKFSTHAERDVLAVSFASFCSSFGQADRAVRFGQRFRLERNRWPTYRLSQANYPSTSWLAVLIFPLQRAH